MNPADLDHPDHWPIERKIRPEAMQSISNWGELVDDTPEMARYILRQMPQTTLEERRQSILALWAWTQACGTHSVEMGCYPDGEPDLRWFPSPGAPQLLGGWGNIRQWTPSAPPIIPEALVKLFQGEPQQATLLARPMGEAGTLALDLGERIMHAERDWFLTSPDAPVARASFQGQEESSASGDVYAAEDATWEWDGTCTLLAAAPGERSAMMERDTYQSDVLRDSPWAAKQAREWDGPYWVQAELHPPSDELRAWRVACNLDADTTPSPDAGKRPRL